ncbi:hypothetical protein [Paraburkholderia sp. BCC1876]|uniref:hypothetical protein n=1 Tax=Paraburkholderia sp. BCC1876 TaxID=2676303 RepID=UPI0015911EC8|nr:hypothetical protein [Paraburkholderia sp. BCC1876]
MAERDLIENIRVLAWVHGVAMEAECKPTQTALTVRFNELQMEYLAAEKAAIAAMEENEDDKEDEGEKDWPEIQFQRYLVGGVTPSEVTLDRVELVLPTTKDAFLIGPKCDSGVAPLWLAMAGPIEAVRAVLNWYDDTLWRAQMAGVPLEQLMFSVTDPILPREIFLEYFPKWDLDVKRNVLAYAINKGETTISMERFTVLVALFRLSILSGIAYPMMDFVMTGLLHKAVYDLFDPWGIARHVKVYLEILRDRQREAMAQGLEMLKKMNGGNDVRYQGDDEPTA